jgi:hypothetical protein
MFNRVQHLFGTPPEATTYTDYYVLEALGDSFIVSFATALFIERQLDRWAKPEWLEFYDVFGARHRLPSRSIYRISESTADTRAAARAFHRARREERKSDEDPFEDLC